MNVIQWATKSVRTRGTTRTLRIAFNFSMDLLFDMRYGTDTMRRVDQLDIDTSSPNKTHSAAYQASKARPLLGLLRELDLPTDCSFVDIGSGKGRVLLIASMYGFRRVLGIEFSDSLCRLSRANVDRFQSRSLLRSPVQVIQTDASTYPFFQEERVFFMYNPFDASIMDKVMANLRASLMNSPRSIWLIYNTPMQHQVVSESGIFKPHRLYEIGGNRFHVYQN